MTVLTQTYMRFRWMQFPAMVLMFVMQRTPVLRTIITTEFTLHATAGTVLKGMIASAAAMGTVHTLAGATELNAGSGGNPVQGAVGESFAGGFSVTGAPAVAGSYRITGTVPAGLTITGIDAQTVNNSVVTITGTPTQSGTFPLSVTAWKGANRTGQGGSPTFTYTIEVAAAQGTAPAISAQPQTQTTDEGQSVTFSVTASGDPAPTFQWRKDGAEVTGATSSTFSISSVATNDAGSYTVVISNASGNVTSASATLTVTAAAVAPAIIGQPQSQAIDDGQSAIFSVTASGDPAPTFQWRKDGAEVTGATSSTFSISSVAASDAGAYTVVVSNGSGNVTSAAANLTVNVLSGEVTITSHPVSQTIAPGGDATFRVTGTGASSLGFQWRKNGQVLAGETSATLVLNAVSGGDSGKYVVVISDSAGSQVSRDAYLLVAAPQPGAIVNESVNTSVGPGASLTVGFVVDGGSREMLIRGAGPTLGLPPFGLSGVLPQPVLQLNATGANARVVATNEGWANNAGIASAGALVGAFAFSSPEDAAVLVTLDAGPYTAVITSGDSASGTAIVEAYASGNGSGQLVNLSARKRLDASNPLLTAGFSINGNVPQRVLIRAVGPSLNQFLNGAELDDTILTLNRLIGPAGEATGVVLSNDDWPTEGNAAEIVTVAASVGAFPLEAGSADAAVLVTLPTGNYTVQVERKGNSVGDTLIEVYAVP